MSPRMLLWLLIAVVFALSLFGTALQRRYSLRQGLIDLPNERSSHTVPTPRSGGAAIVIATLLGLLVINRLRMLDDSLCLAMMGGGTAIAIIGYLDDRFTLSALPRLIVHLAAASWLLFCLGGLPALSFGGAPVNLGWTGNILGVAAIVWVINLFNFMDGIDGFAASEAIFVAVAAAVLMRVGPAPPELLPAALVFAAACAGFLFWNWSPAKIFMGDVGSGFLGFVVASLGLGAARAQPEAAVVFLILGGVFFVDATTTLVRRMLRGEHFYQAHRIHAYQWLARRLGSHRRIVVGLLAINIAWLIPCAMFALHSRKWMLAWLALALVPLVLFALLAGAGRRQDAS
jgi:Fuc2NAc and GlcNAc transferase